MKLWGDVPWEGGPRKVYLVRQVVGGVLFAVLAYAGLPLERNLCGGARTAANRDDILTLLAVKDLGKRTFGSGGTAEIREMLLARGYRIKWK
jgi:hypothetical protein